MKLSAILAPMIAANVPGNVILDTVKAFEEQQADALEQRRKVDAERQARKRERDASRDVTLRHSDRSLMRAGDARVEDKTSNLDIEPQKKEKKGATRASRLPADWTLPHEWRQDAIAAGIPENMIDQQAVTMRDWSLSSPKGAKLDWHAAWRNWCARAATEIPQARGSPVPKRTTALDVGLELIRNMEAADAGPNQKIERDQPAPLSLSRYG